MGLTFEVDALGTKSIDTVDPDNIESILSTRFSGKPFRLDTCRSQGRSKFDWLIVRDPIAVYGLGQRHRNFGKLLGDGIFTQDGALWKHSREILRPLFSLTRKSILVQLKEHTDQLLQLIPSNEFVDLQPLFFRFTFDTTTFLLFGKSLHSLQPRLAQGAMSARVAEFSEAFRVAQDLLFRRERLGELYWLYGSREYRKNCKIVHQFIDEVVQETLSGAYQDETIDEQCFLNSLIRETRDPKVLRDQLLNIMLAGRDTTACCMTWTLFVSTLPWMDVEFANTGA